MRIRTSRRRTYGGIFVFLAMLLVTAPLLAATDWPTYQQNDQRNAFVESEVHPESLSVDWHLGSPQVPQPAWYGPAKWDAYANLRDLHSMRNYDPVFHAIGAEGRVYYGSSVEQCVKCVDAASGELRWSFFTNGPVRVPPAYSDGKLYFGSDDGFAYCLNAQSGKLVWKFSPTEAGRWIVNDGNYIPLWPIRTGVTVDKGTAYFAASLLPWNKTYMCAVNAKTGKPKGQGHYVREYEGLTLEGPFAATGEVLVAPQGRVEPMLFARKDGKKLGSLNGGGGAFVVISGEEVLHGPGNKAGWITRSNTSSRDRLATHKNARGVLVIEGVSYLLTDDSVLALGQKGTESLWQSECDEPLAMVGVGDFLFVGGIDRVTAFDRRTGTEVWQVDVDGRAYGLAFADERLLVSTDTGTIYSFAESGRSAPADPGPPSVAPAENSEQDSASAEGLASIVEVNDSSLVGRWVFQPPHAKGQTVSDLVGELDGKIVGKRAFERIGDIQALSMDGSTTAVSLAENHSSADLPAESLTAEAWVRVDKPMTWGGVVGAVHDNGSDESGWLLGFRDSKLSWALAGVEGAPRLTYLIAPQPFVPGGWHHVVGTYDGKEMRLYVDGTLVGTNKAQQGKIDYPTATPYVIGAYRDSNEDYPMTGRVHEVRIYDRALSAADVSANYETAADRFPTVPAAPTQELEHFQVAAGPWLTFVRPDEAVVRWQTEEPMATRLVYRLEGDERTFESSSKTTSHEARVTGLRHNRVYHYVIEALIDGETETTAEYECDTFFNYCEVDSSDLGNTSDSNVAKMAKDILDSSGIRQGLCVDLDIRTGLLARQLVAESRLRVIGITSSANRAEELRGALQAEGLYGSRIAVLVVDDPKHLPLTAHSVNLVVQESNLDATLQTAFPKREVARLLAPRGKAVSRGRENSDRFETFTGPIFEGAGEWSHAYGRANNSAFGGESLAGVTSRDDLAVQWIGRPGPRYQSDRSGRKPPPLSTAGRIYLQGLDRMISVDAHNGTVLWSLETPHFGRQNLPRDCSNWCADSNHVFAAVRDRCWKISAATGKVESLLPVLTNDLPVDEYEWGYVASVGDGLIGSSVRSGSSTSDFWGGAGWYDGIGGDAVKKVCSDRVFALEKSTGKARWTHEGTVVLNSTITAGDSRIWFVECRHPTVLSGEPRSIGAKELYESLYLVALDVKTGQKLWDKQLDIVTPDVALSLAFSNGRLVLVGSNAASKSFHIYNFAADDGYQVWNRAVVWGKGTNDHGTHLSRPAIVGSRLVVRPAVMNLATGELADSKMPVSGCGTYSCTSAAMFFRAWSGQDFAMWDFEKGDYTRWSRLRPDCWLSSVPADGLLLAPEGGGGCSCGKWLETSLAFIPRSRLEE
ncbi:MAG: LamG-like jellyroll fold domain-containing protein [Aeoliella sp.]